MLSLKPIPENEASGEVAEVYKSIRQTFGLLAVPIVFRYMAVFPRYLSFIWQQALKNLNDQEFKNEAKEIETFSLEAIKSVYHPSSFAQLFLEKMENRAEKIELKKFVYNISQMNASLYLLSIAIRESLKGRFLGIKQIGEKMEENEKTIFNDLSEGLLEKTDISEQKSEDVRLHSTTQLSYKSPTGITSSVFAEFFNVMDKEMQRLLKEEKYLTRRVELERFALSRLHLIPHPLDSSISNIFKQAYNHPQFPELIYLTSDLFPTQTPFKLMASAVMKESLDYSLVKANTRSTELSVV